jgi:hypothetical protein
MRNIYVKKNDNFADLKLYDFHDNNACNLLYS